MASNHAIIFGASGVIGWSLVNQLLDPYPDAGTFCKVTAVTNRPLKLSETYWPEPSSKRPELQLVSGIDLRQGDGTSLAESLKRTVKDVESVTHIYYLVFGAVKEISVEVATNRQMFKNVIDAHNLISPNLKFIAFPGGTRGYGIYAPGGTFTPPLREEMVNDLPTSYAETVVYTEYRKLLDAASKEKSWTWCEVCPDAIIGFTPNGSQYSLSLHWAQYLSLWAYNHGIGPHTNGTKKAVEVPFPGSSAGSTSLFSPVSSKTIARFMIYASLHPERCGNGQLFNIADNSEPCKYGEIWPYLANWFGLVGVGPADSPISLDNTLKVGEVPETTPSIMPGDYIAEHKGKFADCGCPNAISGGVGVGNRQLDSVGYWLTFDRELSLKKLRATGFEGDTDPVQGWLESFEMFRKAGLIL
ncbi:uncharacterized protein N7511_003448 [Penicillium nucicola]|uniref:uncharacterized protein n=1 Tax=Penicillium nucicola TaxID=1850975 RepID=UPI002544F7F1|nr:uncharacterized protein N7511_003448 [Penicillium nucicola]KAJ5771397.1 hypothetical protein N7511_003448 [Penicillium nucicola]